MTADSTILIAIKADGSGAKVIKRDLDEISQKSQATTKSVDVMKNAFSAAFAAFTIRAVVTMADNIAMLKGRLDNATRSAQESTQAFDGLRQIAQKTGSNMETVVSVFQRLSFVRDEIKATTNEMLQFTETVSKLGVVSGASPDALKNGLTQLGQSLSSNIVRAEEFNSIMENIPAVGVAIAEQFGVTTGQLRNLVIEGRVLSEDVFAAMLNAAGEVEEKFNNMPVTIGRAFSALQSDIELFTAQTASGSGAVATMIGIIDTLRVAVFGLGTAFELVVATIGKNMAYILKAIEVSVNSIIKLINFAITQANKLPTINIEKIGNVNFAGGSFSDISKSSDDQIREILNRKPPQGTVFDRIAGNTGSQATKTTRTISQNYAEIAKGITDTTKGNDKFNKSLDKTLKATKDVTKEIEDPLTDAVNSLGDGLEKAFKDGFKSGSGLFDKFIDGVKSTFKEFITNIALSATKPIFLNLVAGVTGGAIGGASGSAFAGSLGGSGGGGSSLLGGLSNISSLLSGGLNTPIFGAGSLVGRGINSIGSALGIGNSSFIGPMLPNASNLASSFTPAAGLAGFGGNILGNLVFGGNRGIGSSIGGTAGGVIGTAIGGPIGAAIGSFLGNAIGGLFGNKKPSDKSQGSRLNLSDLTSSTSGQTGKKFSQENRTFADQVTEQAKNIATALKTAGATLTGSLNILVGSRDGLRVNGANYGQNSKSFIDGVAQAVLKNVSDAPADLKELISRIAGKDAQSIADALDIYGLVKSFEDVGKATKPLKDALDTLDAQFKSLKDKATDLGLPTDKLTESYEKQKTALIRDVLSPLQDFLDSQALSNSSSLNPAQRLSLARSAFDTNLSAIQGGDFTNLSDITNQASQLLSIGRDVFASGEAFTALESYVRQSVSGIAGDLGAPNGLNDSISREIALSTAQQVSIQEQMLVELQETRAENTKLRKTLERLTNQVVIQA